MPTRAYRQLRQSEFARRFGAIASTASPFKSRHHSWRFVSLAAFRFLAFAASSAMPTHAIGSCAKVISLRSEQSLHRSRIDRLRRLVLAFASVVSHADSRVPATAKRSSRRIDFGGLSWGLRPHLPCRLAHTDSCAKGNSRRSARSIAAAPIGAGALSCPSRLSFAMTTRAYRLLRQSKCTSIGAIASTASPFKTESSRLALRRPFYS